MALRLRVVSEHRRLLGERSSIVIGVGGGSIGRSADNDWVLPDPLRYVSARHARISFRQGQYFIEDLSTNGSFVNDDDRPLASWGPYPLKQGDVLRLGDYQVVVVVDNEAEGDEARTPGRTPSSSQPPANVNVVRSASGAAQRDLGASLKLDELLVPDSSNSDSFGPVDAYGQRAPASARHAVAKAAVATEDEEEPDTEAISRRIERLAKAAARKNGAGPALYDVHTGLEAFCRGAGVDAERLPGDAQTRLLHLAGQLFREALVGLKDLDRAQKDERNRFRIETPVDPDDTRPSLARSTIEDLVIELLKQHESRRIDAVQWIRETMGAAKLHERASAEATRAAFVEFVDRLDPDELEARFERARRGKKVDRSQHWELYVEFYRNLTEMPQGHLPHTYVEAFGTAYRAVKKS